MGARNLTAPLSEGIRRLASGGRGGGGGGGGGVRASLRATSSYCRLDDETTTTTTRRETISSFRHLHRILKKRKLLRKRNSSDGWRESGGRCRPQSAATATVNPVSLTAAAAEVVVVAGVSGYTEPPSPDATRCCGNTSSEVQHPRSPTPPLDQATSPKTANPTGVATASSNSGGAVSRQRRRLLRLGWSSAQTRPSVWQLSLLRRVMHYIRQLARHVSAPRQDGGDIALIQHQLKGLAV